MCGIMMDGKDVERGQKKEKKNLTNELEGGGVGEAEKN